MLMTAVACIAGCTKPESSSGSYNGHDYVDLGLPSGTMWATCNVGATTPEGYGDYFAWGETHPKDSYNWSTYKYCEGENYRLTKYCNKSGYGYNSYTDNLTVLQPEDDAATANWGNGWCVPTYDQWEELYENTTSTWTTQNGVHGILFTASNGKTLFLPAAGVRWDDVLPNESFEAGSDGFYWSNSLITYDPRRPWACTFGSDHYRVYDDGRYRGLSVRAVRY